MTACIHIVWVFSLLLAGVGISQSVSERWEFRLSALEPANPLDYFELGEEILDALPGDVDAQRLARQLFGTAGRLDRVGLGASAALAIATLTTDELERERLNAVAMMLDTDPKDVKLTGPLPALDAETSLKLSEALGGFRSGRGQRLRSIMGDQSRRTILATFDDLLPGGIEWLEEASRRTRSRPDLSDRERVQMLRVEILILEMNQPQWSTEILGGFDEPLTEIRLDEIDELLGGDPGRPFWREGRWVGVQDR